MTSHAELAMKLDEIHEWIRSTLPPTLPQAATLVSIEIDTTSLNNDASFPLTESSLHGFGFAIVIVAVIHRQPCLYRYTTTLGLFERNKHDCLTQIALQIFNHVLDNARSTVS
jgi:hypothetical protein